MFKVLFLVSSHFCATMYNAKFHLDCGQAFSSDGAEDAAYFYNISGMLEKEGKKINLYDVKGSSARLQFNQHFLSNSVPLDCTYQYSLRNKMQENMKIAL